MSDFVCNKCNSNFSNIGNLNKHFKTSKKCGNKNDNDKKTSESNEIITLLREQFKTMEEMYKSKIKFLQDEVKELNKRIENNEKEYNKSLKTEKEKHKQEIKDLRDEFKSKKSKSPSPPKEKKSKSPSPSKKSKSPSPPPPPSRIAEDSKEFTVRKNKFGNFEHRSGLLFNSNKKVYGRQKDDGTILPLTEEDIDLCKSSKFAYEVDEVKEVVKKQDEKVEEEEETPYEQGYKECERKLKEEVENLLSIELTYFDKDSNGNPHIGGISKSSIDNMKNRHVADRKASKDYKALSNSDKEKIETYCKYKADKTLFEKLHLDYINYGYKGNNNDEEEYEK